MDSPADSAYPASMFKAIGWFLAAALLVAAGYALWEEPGNDPGEAQRLLDALGAAPGAVVAEIGAGDGALAARIAPRVSRMLLTEIDAGKRAKLARRGLANVQVLQAGIRDTGLPEGCCDAAYSRHVYHHFDEPEALNRSLFRALKPGARVVIVDFEPRLLWPPGKPSARRSGHGVPRKDVAAEMRGAGFEVVREEDPWLRGRFAIVFRRP